MSTERRDKAERLLNLTLALLHTKRPLAKEEIFQSIPGYSGAVVAQERMFERDKDELREMGISIEVLPIDPLFEDELGYRIFAQDFFLPEIIFSVEESLWLALALNQLRDSDDFGVGRGGLYKLFSTTDGQIEELVVFQSDFPITIPLNRTLDAVWSNIKEAKPLRFRYSAGREEQTREASPYMVTTKTGQWYLVARDHSDNNLKTFRIDRIEEVYPPAASKETHFRETSKDEIESFLRNFRSPSIDQVRILIRQELAVEHPLIRRSNFLSNDSIVEVGEVITISKIDPLEIREMILWSGESVEVLEPIELRREIIDSLKRIIQVHS